MAEQIHKQKVVTLIVDTPNKKTKSCLHEYPELSSLFEQGLYIESFNQCRLSKKKFSITFVFRHYNSA
jgi:hypothetical protein